MIWQWLKKHVAAQSEGSSPSELAAVAWPQRDAIISQAARLSGLVADTPEAIAFYQSAFAGHPDHFVTYRDLRKVGRLLNVDELKAIGLRANTKLSAAFFDTLNDTGRGDPLEASCTIGITISTALCTLRSLMQMEAAGIDSAVFHASETNTGPCAAASKLDGQTIPLANVPMLPLEMCGQSGACACHYQARFTLLDD